MEDFIRARQRKSYLVLENTDYGYPSVDTCIGLFSTPRDIRRHSLQYEWNTLLLAPSNGIEAYWRDDGRSSVHPIHVLEYNTREMQW